jgi:mannose/fructose/N-acetylgalactosamine-specific phosphotransferase system component IID
MLAIIIFFGIYFLGIIVTAGILTAFYLKSSDLKSSDSEILDLFITENMEDRFLIGLIWPVIFPFVIMYLILKKCKTFIIASTYFIAGFVSKIIEDKEE